MGALGGGPHGQLSRSCKIGHSGLSLQLAVLHHREFIVFLNHHIALRKPLADVPHGKFGHSGDVVAQETGMDRGRFRLHGLQRIVDRRKLLIFHPDQP